MNERTIEQIELEKEQAKKEYVKLLKELKNRKKDATKNNYVYFLISHHDSISWAIQKVKKIWIKQEDVRIEFSDSFLRKTVDYRYVFNTKKDALIEYMDIKKNMLQIKQNETQKLEILIKEIDSAIKLEEK